MGWRGAPLKIGRRQVRAVLYRLSADINPVSREQLSFLIWSDMPEATTRRYLAVGDLAEEDLRGLITFYRKDPIFRAT